MDLTVNRDRQDLTQLEEVINNNLVSFYATGKALTEIRDRELYKLKNGSDYQTFEAYCRNVWHISRPRAYQLIDAANVQDNLSTIVDKLISEGQARPLAKLNPEQQRGAWQKAIETAPEGKMTATHISKVVKKITGEQTKPKSESKQKTVTETIPENATDLADNAIFQLSRIAANDPDRDDALSKVEDWIIMQRENRNATVPQIPGFTNTELLESRPFN